MVIIVLLMGQILKDLSPVKRREIISLALSASHLGTKYLNKIFVIERGQYNELGILMISVALIGLTLPIATVVFFNPTNDWPGKNSFTGLELNFQVTIIHRHMADISWISRFYGNISQNRRFTFGINGL